MISVQLTLMKSIWQQIDTVAEIPLSYTTIAVNLERP